MIWILYGALGALGVLALLGAGFAAGWMGHRLWWERVRTGGGAESGEGERLAALAEQAAFEGMLHYNTDTAYGVVSSYENAAGGEG